MMLERLRAFMNEFVYPNERVYDEQLAAAETRWSVLRGREEGKSLPR
jgi:acyl-CoA dehydrogenase